MLALSVAKEMGVLVNRTFDSDTKRGMRILIADDDRVSRHLLHASLSRWGYEVIVAKDGLQAWQVLQAEDGPQIAVLDWMMPGLDGVEICRRVRTQPSDGYKYLLLLTARSQKQDVIAGLDSGADDYVTKPFDAFELEARIRTGKRIIELHDALRMQASHDHLTGLWNRSAILEMAEREISRASRQKSPISIMMADLDHFKTINDTLGHTVGDVVLFEVAQRLSLSVRAYDWVGRYGGEEFMIITPNISLVESVQVAERVRSAIAKSPVTAGIHKVDISCSIGIASTDAGPWNDVQTMINAADRALYVAKDQGRNRIHCADFVTSEAQLLGLL